MKKRSLHHGGNLGAHLLMSLVNGEGESVSKAKIKWADGAGLIYRERKEG